MPKNQISTAVKPRPVMETVLINYLVNCHQVCGLLELITDLTCKCPWVITVTYHKISSLSQPINVHGWPSEYPTVD